MAALSALVGLTMIYAMDNPGRSRRRRTLPTPPALAFAETLDAILEAKIDRLERQAIAAEAAGNTAMAADKRAQKSRYRYSNITKALGKSSFEELHKGRIQRAPRRELIEQLARHLKLDPTTTDRLLEAAGYHVRRSDLITPDDRKLSSSIPAKSLPYLLAVPSFSVTRDGRVEAVNAPCQLLIRLYRESQPADVDSLLGFSASPSLVRIAKRGATSGALTHMIFFKVQVPLAGNADSTVYALLPFDDSAKGWIVSSAMPQHVDTWSSLSPLPQGSEPSMVPQRDLSTSAIQEDDSRFSAAMPVLGDHSVNLMYELPREPRHTGLDSVLLDPFSLLARILGGGWCAIQGLTPFRSKRCLDPSAQFLRAAGLRYRGRKQPLAVHIERLTREPDIPLDDIALGLTLSYKETHELFACIGQVKPIHAAPWAVPLGELLRPLIRYRIEEEYDSLAEGYELTPDSPR